MSKKLDEAIKILKRSCELHLQVDEKPNEFDLAIETVLKELDNSIPKEKIEEILEDYQERKRYYDDKNIANDEEYYRIEGVIRISRELLEGK